MQIFIKKAKRSFSGCCRLFAPETLTSGSPTTAHTCSSSPSDIHCGCGLKSWLLKSVSRGRAWEERESNYNPYSPSSSVSVLSLCRKPSTKVMGHFRLSSGYFDYLGVRGSGLCWKKWLIQTFSDHGERVGNCTEWPFQGSSWGRGKERSTEMCWYLSSSLR